MNDPYKVLGIHPNATEAEIKQAYRELAKKYHPDNYADNPLADLASEKMQEINEAYDTIMNRKKSGSGSDYGSYGGTYAGESSSQFGDIRRLIREQRIAEAQELLDGVSNARRDGEWYFLRGTVYHSKGWLEEALRCYTQARQMEPNNPEYANAYNQLLWQRQAGRASYGGSGGGYNAMGCSVCDLCTALYCASCLGDACCY